MKNLFITITLLIITYSKSFGQFSIDAIPDSITICQGDSIQLQVNINTPTPCLPNNDNSCFNLNQIWGDTGIANISNSPTPYYGFFDDGRIQVLYTASELNTLGFTSGKITEIAFEITNKQSIQPFTDFTIKMGCTSLTNFNNTLDFIPNLNQVYYNSSYTSLSGINSHVLDSSYEWDGTSNIIIEACFNNISWTSQDLVTQTNQTDSMSLYAYSDAQIGCNLNSSITGVRSTSIRPNIRFTYCSSSTNPNNYTYLWSPSSWLSDTTTSSPSATPNNTTNYIVTVTDSISGISKTDTIFVTVDICTSIPDTKKLYNLKIYPNPTDGLIYIESSLKIKENATINLMSVEGKLVYSKLLLKDLNSWNIDLSHLNKGVYLLHFNYNNQKSIKKIILN